MVLVNDGNDAQAREIVQRVTEPAVAFRLREVLVGHQHLRSGDSEISEFDMVEGSKRALAGGSAYRHQARRDTSRFAPMPMAPEVTSRTQRPLMRSVATDFTSSFSTSVATLPSGCIRTFVPTLTTMVRTRRSWWRRLMRFVLLFMISIL